MLIDKTEKEQAFHAQMLSDCADILDMMRIPYHLSNSALLGAYRDGDMIPWSFGAVINVNYEKVKPAEEQIKAFLIEKGFTIARHFKKRSNWKIRADKSKFNIEITGYHLVDGFYQRKANGRYRKMPAKYIDGPSRTKIMLRGREYKAPYKIEKFLDYMYIDWSTVIREERRSSYKNPKHIGK